MHEFELGVWKAILIHLLRILDCVGRLALLNERCDYHLAMNWYRLTLSRFRKVPTYGDDTIRRFCRNVSDLKQMAARVYEDILQV